MLLSTWHGERLNALRDRFSLVWATTWGTEANQLLSPLLGLPTDLPVIEWPEHALERHPRVGRNGSWKTPYVAAWLDAHAPGLPWVWVDDEVNRFDRAWIAQHYATGAAPPHLLHRVEADRGLVEDDFARLAAFADTQ